MDKKTLIEIQEHIDFLNEKVGLSPETIQDVRQAIDSYQAKRLSFEILTNILGIDEIIKFNYALNVLCNTTKNDKTTVLSYAINSPNRFGYAVNKLINLIRPDKDYHVPDDYKSHTKYNDRLYSTIGLLCYYQNTSVTEETAILKKITGYECILFLIELKDTEEQKTRVFDTWGK